MHVSNLLNKSTEHELDRLTDSEELLFIEKSIRGGISVISHRHAKVDNHLIPDYDLNSPITISLTSMLIICMVKQ